MNSLPDIAAVEAHSRPVILAVFGITYMGIAMGRVPGLKLNRVGIALLGAITLMIFGRHWHRRGHFLHQLADDISAVWILRALGATAPVRILRPGGQRHFRAARKSRAVSARTDAGHRRPLGISESRHRLLRFCAHCRNRAAPQTAQSHSVPDRAGHREQYRRGGDTHRQSPGHDDRPGRAL